MKKLAASVITLIVSLVCVASVSYAWFSMNEEVEATGMSVKINPAVMLLISDDEALDTLFQPEISENASLNYSQLSAHRFQTSMELQTDAVLLPASSSDAVSFWNAKLINSDGQAIPVADGLSYSSYSPVTPALADHFYFEKDYYLTAMTPADGENTVMRCYIGSAEITRGNNTPSLIHQAARFAVKITYMEDGVLSTQTVIFRYKNADGTIDAVGNPASSVNTVVSDPSIPTGTYTLADENTFDFDIKLSDQDPAAPGTPRMYIVKMTLCAWIEGNSSYAVSENIGGAFNFAFSIDSDPSLYAS